MIAYGALRAATIACRADGQLNQDLEPLRAWLAGVKRTKRRSDAWQEKAARLSAIEALLQQPDTVWNHLGIPDPTPVVSEAWSNLPVSDSLTPRLAPFAVKTLLNSLAVAVFDEAGRRERETATSTVPAGGGK